MRTLAPFSLARKLEQARSLDPAAGLVRDVVRKVLPPGPVRDTLHGVWMGHPVHPLAVQVPLGAWLSASVLDVLPGSETAAAVLIGVGVLASGTAALSGVTDFSELHEQQQRVGLVHAVTMDAATALYALSLFRRLTGRGNGRATALAGLATAVAGGWLGGHMSFTQAAAANHAEDVPHRIEPGWHRIAALAELVPGVPQRRLLNDVPLLLVRSSTGEQVRVLSGLCSHLSGPLAEGTVERVAGAECIVCPWHGSTFDLDSGEPVRGPATAPQSKFETRVIDGTLEVMLPGAG
ncbi:MAG: Rieske 2Fe-2S domain-containing protein [Actinomycetales bacterium]